MMGNSKHVEPVVASVIEDAVRKSVKVGSANILVDDWETVWKALYPSKDQVQLLLKA